MQRQYHDPYAYYGQEQDPAQAAAAGAQSQQQMAQLHLQQQALLRANQAQRRTSSGVAGAEVAPEQRLAIWTGIGALAGFFFGPQLLGLRELTGALLGAAGGFYAGMEKEKRVQAQVRHALQQQRTQAAVPPPAGAPYDPHGGTHPPPNVSFIADLVDQAVTPPGTGTAPAAQPPPMQPPAAQPPPMQPLNGGTALTPSSSSNSSLWNKQLRASSNSLWHWSRTSMQPVIYEEGEGPSRRPTSLERRRARKGRWRARQQERVLRRRFSTRRWPAVSEPSVLLSKFGEEKKGKRKGKPEAPRAPEHSRTDRLEGAALADSVCLSFANTHSLLAHPPAYQAAALSGPSGAPYRPTLGVLCQWLQEMWDSFNAYGIHAGPLGRYPFEGGSTIEWDLFTGIPPHTSPVAPSCDDPTLYPASCLTEGEFLTQIYGGVAPWLQASPLVSPGSAGATKLYVLLNPSSSAGPTDNLLDYGLAPIDAALVGLGYRTLQLSVDNLTAWWQGMVTRGLAPQRRRLQPGSACLSRWGLHDGRTGRLDHRPSEEPLHRGVLQPLLHFGGSR